MNALQNPETCALGVQIIRTGVKPMHELKGAMEKLQRNRLKQHALTNSRAHGCAFSSDHAFCSGHAQERVFENTRHVRLIRLETATGMSDSDAIRCKMSTSCISKPA